MKKVVFPKLKRTLWQLLGPSIILTALALSGGELLIWPSVTANYGFAVLWAIPIVVLLQFFVNIEIERYTLITGRSVEEDMTGKRPWLAIVFALTVLVTLVWPAWITTAGNLVSYLLFGSASSYGLITSFVLLALTLFIFKYRKTYSILELIAKIGLAAVILIIIGVAITLFDKDIFAQGLLGFTHIGFIPSELPRFEFLGALAFGGVAGVLNLVQSEWVLDKGYGVAGLKEKERKDVELTSKQSKKNFREWFKTINTEHFLVFFVANVFSIFLLAYIGRLLLPAGSAQGFGVLTAEIAALNAHIPYLGILFGIAATLVFVMANVTILDVIGRLSYRLLAPLRNRPKADQSRTGKKLASWTSSRISTLAIWIGLIILIGSFLVPSFRQPYSLLITSAALSAITMWLYPPLLLKMNLGLPKVARPSYIRIAMIIIATLFYGFFSLWALSVWLPIWALAVVGVLVTGYQLNAVIKH